MLRRCYALPRMQQDLISQYLTVFCVILGVIEGESRENDGHVSIIWTIELSFSTLRMCCCLRFFSALVHGYWTYLNQDLAIQVSLRTDHSSFTQVADSKTANEACLQFFQSNFGLSDWIETIKDMRIRRIFGRYSEDVRTIFGRCSEDISEYPKRDFYCYVFVWIQNHSIFL